MLGDEVEGRLLKRCALEAGGLLPRGAGAYASIGARELQALLIDERRADNEARAARAAAPRGAQPRAAS